MNWMPRVQATGTTNPANYRVSVRILGTDRSGPETPTRGEALIVRENALGKARFRARTVIAGS